MYHYTECGLKNIWLVNGYHQLDTPYGRATSIEDLAGLHSVIVDILVNRKPTLTGAEFRFLRKELGLSQARLADLLGNNSQSVAVWEKTGRIPKWADRLIRIICREKCDGNVTVIEFIDRLNDLDQRHDRKQLFEESSKGWMPKAA